MIEPGDSRDTLPPLGAAGLVAATSALLAVSFGFNFGFGNQTSYLLPALRLLDPELFARDWAVSSATQYHQAFAYLVAPLLALDPSGWAVALTLTLVAAASALALHAACRALVGPKLALPCFLLLATVLLRTRTAGPGSTYVFDGTLQPSSLSNALLLGATAAHVAGRFRLSGALLALAGLFHLNFALLSVFAFGAAELILGRERLGRRLLVQLGPACLVLLLFVPTLLGAAKPSAETELGRFVYLYVRAPHHFALSDKVPEFFPLAGFTLAAGALVQPLLPGERGAPFRRLAACVLGLSAVVWLGVLAALVSDGARALFSWRLAPATEVLLEVGALTAVTRLVMEPEHARVLSFQRLAVVLAGLALTFAGWALSDRSGPLQVVAVIGVAAAVSLAAKRRFPGCVNPRTMTLFGSLLFAGFALHPLRRVPRYSSLLSAEATSETSLFRWMQSSTEKSALFLVPPELGETRLLSHRSIVIDWKNNPGVPSEVLTWYRRLEDVTGRPGFRSAEDLAGYDAMDPARFDRLRARYGFDYAVVRRGRELAFPDHDKPYQNADYVVLRPRAP